MTVNDNERIDYVNDSLSLIQKTDGLTFGTDALLLAGYVAGKFTQGLEIGGGSGIISMLLLARDKVGVVHSVEVQPEYAELIARNAEYNGLNDRLFSVCADVRNYSHKSEVDIVFSNPPYMKSTSGRHNAKDAKRIARHEIHGDIDELILSGARLLKYGGSFYTVYRPDRLCDIICAMRGASVEPKRMTYVYADVKKEPSMVLIEAKKGGKSGINVTRPLIIYRDSAHREYSEDMNYIMETGNFPSDFKR